jgi:hypothetical protein
VVEVANVSSGLWLSYLFALLYLVIAAGGISHKDLFLENPVKLPFLSVDLLGFFVLGPLLFVIVHAYTLLHFTLLADKIGVFHKELQARSPTRIRGLTCAASCRSISSFSCSAARRRSATAWLG